MTIDPITTTLKNGGQIVLRELRPGDRERIAKAVRSLDEHSVYTRLFSHRKERTDAGLDRCLLSASWEDGTGSRSAN